MNISNGIGAQVEITRQERTTPPVTAKAVAIPTAPSPAGQNDTAVLSSAANQLSHASADSEVRLDKVASVQSALLAGTYHVDAKDVAKKVVDSMITTN